MRLLKWAAPAAGLSVFAVVVAGAQTPAGGRAGGGGARRTIQVMTLTPSDWKDGGMVPSRHAQPGRDVSPALAWGAAPPGTASFALIVHDIDAPAGNGLDDALHWMIWNIPATATSLPEGIPAGGERADGSRQISASGPYYRGPAAPAMGPVHHYVFELFALDTTLTVPAVGAAPTVTRAAVVAGMAGHVRGKATLVGLYRRAP